MNNTDKLRLGNISVELELGVDSDQYRVDYARKKRLRFEFDAIKGEILGNDSCCWSSANEAAMSVPAKKPLDKLGIFCGRSAAVIGFVQLHEGERGKKWCFALLPVRRRWSS